MNFFLKKILLIFDIANWLWKYDFSTFWQTIIHRRILKSCILGSTIFKIPQPNCHYYTWVYSIVIFQFFFSWSITWSYFTFHGYLWTDFLEYPLLLIQQITVICLYFHINKTLSKIGTFAFLVVYFLTVYSWLQSPEWFLQILIVR